MSYCCASEREQDVVDALSVPFGPQAAKPDDHLKKRWTAEEIWSRGDPTGRAPPGW